MASRLGACRARPRALGLQARGEEWKERRVLRPREPPGCRFMRDVGQRTSNDMASSKLGHSKTTRSKACMLKHPCASRGQGQTYSREADPRSKGILSSRMTPTPIQGPSFVPPESASMRRNNTILGGLPNPCGFRADMRVRERAASDSYSLSKR